MKEQGKKAELQSLFVRKNKKIFIYIKFNFPLKHLGRDGITKFLCKMILTKQWI